MSERQGPTGITAIKTRLAELEELRERVDEVEAENRELRERVDEVEAANEDLQEENEELRERVTALEEQPEFDVLDKSDPLGSLTVDGAPLGRVINRKVSKGDFKTELNELEARLGDVTPSSPETDKSASQTSYEPETPLEQIVGLPESMVQEQLTANQDRARFIARDIREYGTRTGTKSTGFNYAIDSGTLKKVLKASYDVSHTETVNRVIEWLDELGKDETLVRTKNGRQKIIFRGDLVRRIETAKQCSENHGTVIAEQEA
jgi:FtsZ-binding cell division protein ZapB